MRIKLKKTVNIGGEDVPKGSVLEIDEAEGRAFCAAACAVETTAAITWTPAVVEAVAEATTDNADAEPKSAKHKK